MLDTGPGELHIPWGTAVLSLMGQELQEGPLSLLLRIFWDFGGSPGCSVGFRSHRDPFPSHSGYSGVLGDPLAAVWGSALQSPQALGWF